MSVVIREGLLKKLRRQSACTPEALRQSIGTLGQALDDIAAAPLVVAEGDVSPGALPLFNERTEERPDIVASGNGFAVAADTSSAENFTPPSAGNKYVGKLKGWRCDNPQGHNQQARHTWFKVLGRAGYTVSIPAGSIFSYTISSQGERTVTSDYTDSEQATKALWAVAQSDSVDGAIDNVTCQLCDDELGTNPSGVNITVLLPERAGFTHKVKSGAVVAVELASNNKYVCVSDYAWERIERWAITTADPVSNQVECRFCDDQSGANVNGDPFDAVLPQRSSAGLFLPIGSVVSIARADNDAWVVQSDYTSATYQHNGSTVATKPRLNFVDNASIAFSVTETGDRVNVSATGLYEHPQRLAGTIKFQLLADLYGGFANATVLDYYGSEDDILYPGATIVVNDDYDEFPLALEDAIGTAQRDVVAGRYLITHCQQMVQRVTGVIPGVEVLPCGLRTDTTTFTVNVADLLPITWSPFNQMPAGTSITIHNVDGWSAANGSRFRAEYHKGEERWELYQIVPRCEDPTDCP
jgi:hypothetical protein